MLAQIFIQKYGVPCKIIVSIKHIISICKEKFTLIDFSKNYNK